MEFVAVTPEGACLYKFSKTGVKEKEPFRTIKSNGDKERVGGLGHNFVISCRERFLGQILILTMVFGLEFYAEHDFMIKFWI